MIYIVQECHRDQDAKQLEYQILIRERNQLHLLQDVLTEFDLHIYAHRSKLAE